MQQAENILANVVSERNGSYKADGENWTDLLDESFCIFTETHIENLKKLPTKEAA